MINHTTTNDDAVNAMTTLLNHGATLKNNVEEIDAEQKAFTASQDWNEDGAFDTYREIDDRLKAAKDILYNWQQEMYAIINSTNI